MSTVPTDTRAQLAVRYREVNGEHPMSTADDAYVDEWFSTLTALCADRAETPDEVRAHMLAGRLPLPGYLRSDGTEMVPADLFRLADSAGGIAELPEWFRAQCASAEQFAEYWADYLSGQLVCLRSVTPTTISRKVELVTGIEAALAEPQPDSADWRRALHQLVNGLDALEPPFAPHYDRLRFGGESSRQRLIDAPRAAYPLD